jgi:hypothetical protein
MVSNDTRIAPNQDIELLRLQMHKINKRAWDKLTRPVKRILIEEINDWERRVLAPLKAQLQK